MTREQQDQYWLRYGYALALAQLGLPHEHQGDRREACDVCGRNDTDDLHEHAMPRVGDVYCIAGRPDFKNEISEVRVVVQFGGFSLPITAFLSGDLEKVEP